MKPHISLIPILCALLLAARLCAATDTSRAGNPASFIERLKPAANELTSSVRTTRSGTVLRLTLKRQKTVTISVTDPAGSNVYTTSRKNLSAGKHSFVIPPRTTRGPHLVKIVTPDEEIVHKVSGW